jgi:5'-3' exonuclease
MPENDVSPGAEQAESIQDRATSLEREAAKQAGGISRLLYDQMIEKTQGAKNKRREQELKEQESALLNQKLVTITLDSKQQLSMQITSTGSDFSFGLNDKKTISTKDIKEFCALINQYKTACDENGAEDLEFELFGNDIDMLKKIALELKKNPGIMLDRIVLNDLDGKPKLTIQGHDEINAFLQETVLKVNKKSRGNP